MNMTLAQYALAATSGRAHGWLNCSKRTIAGKQRNGTYNKALALRLLANNARDFARERGQAYTQQELDICAAALLRHITLTSAV